LGNAVRGVKAGVIAGVVYGIALAVLSYITVISQKNTIITDISNKLPADSPFTAQELYSIVVFSAPLIAAVGGVVGGVIVGALYGRFFEKLPGGRPIVKGIVVAIFLWFVIGVLLGLGNLQYGVVTYLSGVGLDLLGALLFGYLLGYFYGRFSGPDEIDPGTAGL
jgi:hypothetical protein